MIFALFFTKGMSFKEWDRLGMLEREILPYQNLALQCEYLFFFTYGGKEDISYASLFPSNVRIFPQKFPMPSKIYSIFLPLLYWKEMKKIDIAKTNQMNGAWSAVIAKKLHGFKLIVRCGYEWLNVMEKRKMARVKLALAALLEQWVYGSADAIIVTSEEIQKFVQNRFRIPSINITVIPNYIDVERFRSLETPKEKDRIIFVGKLEDQKNIFSLIEALEGLSFHLVIIGSGTHRKSLEEFAKNKRVKVIFKGNIPQSALPGELNRSTLFVLPSHYEGNPKVLLEAMACGLPCIGTDVEGIRLVLRHRQNGYICKEDSDSIRKSVVDVMKDEQLQKKLGVGARATVVEQFRFEKVFEKELKTILHLR